MVYGVSVPRAILRGLPEVGEQRWEEPLRAPVGIGSVYCFGAAGSLLARGSRRSICWSGQAAAWRGWDWPRRRRRSTFTAPPAHGGWLLAAAALAGLYIQAGVTRAWSIHLLVELCGALCWGGRNGRMGRRRPSRGRDRMDGLSCSDDRGRAPGADTDVSPPGFCAAPLRRDHCSLPGCGRAGHCGGVWCRCKCVCFGVLVGELRGARTMAAALGHCAAPVGQPRLERAHRAVPFYWIFLAAGGIFARVSRAPMAWRWDGAGFTCGFAGVRSCGIWTRSDHLACAYRRAAGLFRLGSRADLDPECEPVIARRSRVRGFEGVIGGRRHRARNRDRLVCVRDVGWNAAWSARRPVSRLREPQGRGAFQRHAHDVCHGKKRCQEGNSPHLHRDTSPQGEATQRYVGTQPKYLGREPQLCQRVLGAHHRQRDGSGQQQCVINVRHNIQPAPPPPVDTAQLHSSAGCKQAYANAGTGDVKMADRRVVHHAIVR